MNRDTLEGQWTQLKGKAREQWGELTEDDIEKVNGSYEQLVGRIQERYGIEKEKARQMVEDWK